MRVVSYSGINSYINCPSAFERRYITDEAAGTPSASPAMSRGTQMHQATEHYLLGKTEELPELLERYRGFFNTLRDQPSLIPEWMWNYSPKWESLDYADLEGMVRGMVDAVMLDGDIAYVYEWKTGKEYPSHSDQRSLYGLAALLCYPQAKEAHVFSVYFDLGYNRTSVFQQDNLVGHKWLWDRKINRMRPPQKYAMRPSWRCKTCIYSKKNGGSCPN